MPLVVLGEALVHVGEACSDAVLMPLQRGQVDGFGQVCGEQLLALGFEFGPVCREVEPPPSFGPDVL
ncbi:hypothetical protein [Micrococcus luteus]|uniref:hypothetical protein n=1 Tax=Micrococcus luteus TaxID=1270 RepID=UPI00119D6FD8|nr:hypothetical protein [Micrococcus luteus]MCV7513884.1 hypothetical protein [Micrococcus luteus]